MFKNSNIGALNMDEHLCCKKNEAECKCFIFSNLATNLEVILRL